MSNEEARLCFVIMPFGTKIDPIRKDNFDFDAVYETIIEKAVKGLNRRGLKIRCIRSDKIEQAGLIHERMIKLIAEADVAVVDISVLNPNVFYELGVRHALRDRVTVIVRRKGTTNPFNIAGMTTIEYDLDPAEAEQATTAITNFIANGLLSSARDSLVYTMLPRLRSSLEPEPAPSSVEEYTIPDAPGKRIGIVCGDLRNVNLGSSLVQHPITIWVSSENVNMEMARSYEASVSAMIRYLGAKKDATAHIDRDTIGDQLKKLMRRRQVVNPGEVVATGPGCLAETHKVKRIYHAASVYGVVGTGFHTIANVERCITNALVRADREYRSSKDETGTSILFPLLGTGTARAEIIASARKQMGAAIDYLRNRLGFTRVERVYFLAPFTVHRSGMQVALAELGIRKPANGTSAQRAEAPPASKKHHPSRQVGKA